MAVNNQVSPPRIIWRTYSGVGILLLIAAIIAGVLAAACFSGYMNQNGHFLFVMSWLFYLLATVI